MSLVWNCQLRDMEGGNWMVRPPPEGGKKDVEKDGVERFT
jgi:hypothetical protein